MAEIVPTILTSNSEDFSSKLAKIEGLVQRIQIDVLDGVFLPEVTVGLDLLNPENIETNLKLDVHLMVQRPEDWIDRCISVLADQVIGQVEMMENKDAFITKVIEAGLKVGLALDLNTPVSAIDDETLTKIDLVLILTRKAGFGNYAFEPKALEKIKHFRKVGSEYLKVCADGGINENNIQECVKAGADIIAVGGVIWEANDIGVEVERLKELANK